MLTFFIDSYMDTHDHNRFSSFHIYLTIYAVIFYKISPMPRLRSAPRAPQGPPYKHFAESHKTPSTTVLYKVPKSRSRGWKCGNSLSNRNTTYALSLPRDLEFGTLYIYQTPPVNLLHNTEIEVTGQEMRKQLI